MRWAFHNCINQNKLIRSINFIGKSSLSSAYPNAIYDELKIYSGALTSDQIANEYNLS